MQKPMVLIVLDGWGLAPPGPGNAISLAKLTHIPSYWHSYPHTELTASGTAVGLPAGEDGNTETGHINIGAGRVVYQDFPRISAAIGDGSFFQNAAFLGAAAHAQMHKSNVHLFTIISDSGVHGSRDHLYALLEMVKRHQCACPIYLHLFTDGRDAPPTSGIRFVRDVAERCAALGVGNIATVMGRYYAMDRDRRWERTQVAYQALTEEIERRSPSAVAAVEAAYREGKTDEFIEPTIMVDSTDIPLPRVKNNDAVIFLNFRIDRPRQLTRAFVLPDFETRVPPLPFDPYAVKYYHKHIVEEDTRQKPFTRNTVLQNLFFVTMTEYERNLPCVVAFPPERIANPLAKVFADRKLRQLHAAETEKERFVSYYFNGLHEDSFSGEDRLIVPSPKVATYDLQPEMSATELTEKLLDRLSLGVYAFVVVNYANPDMVAHSGNIPASVRACEVTDECVGKLVARVLELDGTCIVTADHGNVEEMLGPNGEMDTEHSLFPVPFMVIRKLFEHYPFVLPKGKLADVAPTLLSLVGYEKPIDMTGNNLLADMPTKGGNL